MNPVQELEEVVKWQDFVKAVQLETGINDITKLNILFPYLAVFGTDKRVTLHSFSNTVRWCGHFFVADRAERIFSEIEALNREIWFHGCIDQLETEGRLHFQPPGSFLIRLSSTKPDYPFTLSLKQRHLRIKRTLNQENFPSFFLPIVDPITGKIQDIAYPTLPDLVKGVRKALELTVGCPKVPASDGYQR